MVAKSEPNIVLSNQEFNVVGTRPIRHDGADKVTGRARYSADVHLPGMLYGKVLRSPHAHAVIKSIDAAKALALSGVKAVVTSADLPVLSGRPVDVAEGSPLNPRFLSNNVLAADKLMRGPKLYATFLLWLLAELFESLPEVGDPEKPKLVFFFDEAHLLFDDAPEALEDKVEQVVRLIRSKGVGVYFVTQNPIDIPEKIAGQLGNRVQHALRAFTPRDKRAIKAAAETFRINPELDVEQAITELKVGEALVSTLDEDGAPTIVQRTLIKPPHSRLGPVTEKERKIINSVSDLDGKYDEAVDRESAEEVLAAKAADAAIITHTRKGRGSTPRLTARATATGVIRTATVALDKSSVANRVTPYRMIRAAKGPSGRMTSINRPAPVCARPVTSMAMPSTTMPAISSRMSGLRPA